MVRLFTTAATLAGGFRLQETKERAPRTAANSKTEYFMGNSHCSWKHGGHLVWRAGQETALQLKRVQQRARGRFGGAAGWYRFGFGVHLAIEDAGVAEVHFQFRRARKS